MILLTSQTQAQIQNQFALRVNHFAFVSNNSFNSFSNFLWQKIFDFFSNQINFFFFHLAIISLVLNPIFLQIGNRIDFDLQFSNFSNSSLQSTNNQSGKISNVYSNIADFSFNKPEVENASLLLFAKQSFAPRQLATGFASLTSLTPEPVFAEKRNAFFFTQKPNDINILANSLNATDASNVDGLFTNNSSLTQDGLKNLTLANNGKGNINQIGSNVNSIAGDINYQASNNVNILASMDTYSQDFNSKTNSQTISISSNSVLDKNDFGNLDNLNGGFDLSFNRSRQNSTSTTYNNSTVIANNGNVNITSGNNAVIKGANILASCNDATNSCGNNTAPNATDTKGNLNLNVGNDLTIASLQNQYHSDGSSHGFNFGLGASKNKEKSGESKITPTISIGVSNSHNQTDRIWTDNQTMLIGNNSVNVNVGTKDSSNNYIKGGNTSITGALIASAKTITDSQGNQILTDNNNLNLATKTLTITNLNDSDISNSDGYSFGVSGLGIPGFGGSKDNSANSSGSSGSNNGGFDAGKPNPTQNKNYFPTGSTTISMNSSGYEKAQTTFATIGNGNININGTSLNDIKTAADNINQAIKENNNPNPSDVAYLMANNLSIDQATKLASINQNINQSQLITKDTITGALNFTTTIDNRILLGWMNKAEGWKSVGSDFVNLPGNSLFVTAGLLKIAALIPISPMAINNDIEAIRGIPQTAYWGDSAVYKDGTEPNGIRDPKANNVGQQNIPINPDTEQVDQSKVGTPVNFGGGVFGFVKWLVSTKEGGLISDACNYVVPGCNDMSLSHDPLANHLKKQYPNIPTLLTNQATIIPAYAVNTYGLVGKPVNMLTDYLDTTAHNIDPTLPQIQVPTISLPLTATTISNPSNSNSK